MHVFTPLRNEAGAAPDAGGGAPPVVPVVVDSTVPPAVEAPVTAPAPADPAPDPWHRSILTEDGKLVEKWVDKLPARFDPHKAMLAQFDDFGTLAEAFKDNMTKARAKTDGMVRVPGADAKPEEIAAYHKAIGVPDDPKDYGIAKPEKMPEGVEWIQEQSDEFGPLAKQIGLTPAQTKALVEWQVGSVGKQAEAGRAAALAGIQAEQAELKEVFGDRLPSVVAIAQQVGAMPEVNLPPGVFDPTSAEYLGNGILRAFSAVARMVTPDRLPTGPMVNNMTPELQARDIVGNPNNPLHALYMKGDREAVRTYNDLMRQSDGQRR